MSLATTIVNSTGHSTPGRSGDPSSPNRSTCRRFSADFLSLGLATTRTASMIVDGPARWAAMPIAKRPCFGWATGTTIRFGSDGTDPRKITVSQSARRMTVSICSPITIVRMRRGRRFGPVHPMTSVSIFRSATVSTMAWPGCRLTRTKPATSRPMVSVMAIAFSTTTLPSFTNGSVDPNGSCSGTLTTLSTVTAVSVGSVNLAASSTNDPAVAGFATGTST